MNKLNMKKLNMNKLNINNLNMNKLNMNKLNVNIRISNFVKCFCSNVALCHHHIW